MKFYGLLKNLLSRKSSKKTKEIAKNIVFTRNYMFTIKGLFVFTIVLK